MKYQFIQNKYTAIYHSIISNAKTRTLENTVYTEKHHIIPKSLGGSNSKSNLVVLTAREHFICHRLLPRMTTGQDQKKMIYALNRMLSIPSENCDRKITSRIFHQIKEEFNKINHFNDPSWQEKYGNKWKGKTHSEETRTRMREAWTSDRRKARSKLGWLGNSESAKRGGKKLKEKYQSGSLENPFKGKTHSAGSREKMKEAATGRIPVFVGQKQICPYCERSFDKGNYSRYHGDKCKFK